LQEYLNLRDKVDQQFDKIFTKHNSEMSCAEGCHDCCAPDLSVTQIEAEMIREFITARPEIVEQLKTLATLNPHQGTRCALLNAEGQCSIYEARPLICRSHGAPVLVQIDAKREGIDACPKNFKSGMTMLDVGDWIHLETLNTLLALVDWRNALDQGRERPDPETDRIPLLINSLLPEQ
jgi:uncharacterized protein